jgi:hypothetical protein
MDDNKKLGIDPLPNYGKQNAPQRTPLSDVECHIDPDGRTFSIVFSGKATRKKVTQNKNVKVLTIEKYQ